MARDFGVLLNPVFDTQEVEKLVTGKKLAVSLTSLWAKYCDEAFDMEILKQKDFYQKADWAQRPLTASMEKYAAHDSHFLLAIASRQLLELDKDDF